MATLAGHRKISAEEFVRMELQPDSKFELEDGFIYAMAGGSPAHARVQANLMRFLGVALRGSGCRPYGSDMPLKTLAHTVRFPDVTVYCGNPVDEEQAQPEFLSQPAAIFEVLSPSTRSLDYGRKLEEYQSLPTVHTVALIDPDEKIVTVYRRDERGVWNDFKTRRTGEIPLEPFGITIPKDEIFARD
jgi:Uma2 family endonuclease